MHIPSAIQIAPLVGIRRERMLPYAGKVEYEAGEDIDVGQIVAIATGQGRLHIIDVAQQFRIPAKKAEAAMLVKVNQKLERGQPVAQNKTLFGTNVIRSPVKGRVLFILSGRLLISANTRPVKIRAHFPGRVIDVEENYGVLIQTTGAVVQGVWGNNKQAYGELVMLEPRGDVGPDSFSKELAGMIAIGSGTLNGPKALKAAMRAELGGLVLASLPSSMLPLLAKVKFPIMITEGFGKHTMLATTRSLLSDSATRKVTLNAQAPDWLSSKRPELLIPIAASENIPLRPLHGDPLAVGQRVRLLRAPYAGQSGAVIDLPPRPEQFPSGIATMAAWVALDQDPQEKVLVPQANLEVIEQGFDDSDEAEAEYEDF